MCLNLIYNNLRSQNLDLCKNNSIQKNKMK